MILSERGAINAAILEGGYAVYPAVRLFEIIKSGLAGDDLRGDFDPLTTVQKIRSISGVVSEAATELFQRDLNLLCKRISKIGENYDIDSIFDKMLEAIPALAKRYYGLEGFTAPRPKIVEYYFEGFKDIYKDADWIAFNVNSAESRELGVPVGTYFKRSQVVPGLTEFMALHEAGHAMQEACYITQNFHIYVPWFDEGFADVFGAMMLARVTTDPNLLKLQKAYATELYVTDPRKVVYQYAAETVAMLLLRGRLPFAKALMQVARRERFDVNWDSFALTIKDGIDPHVALISSYIGSNKETFRKRVERDEAKYRKEGDLDQTDLKVLSATLCDHAPGCIDVAEYNAALWMDGEIKRGFDSPHFVDPEVIPEEARKDIAEWSSNTLVPISKVPHALWKKNPYVPLKVVICDKDIPAEHKDGVNAMANNFYIVKREIGGQIVYEPYGGGLPYRLGTGELRCRY